MGKGIVGASGKMFFPGPNLAARKTDPSQYSLKIIKMNCGNTTIRPFIPLRKNYTKTVSSEWTERKPNIVIWGFTGDGKTSKFRIYAQFEFANENGNQVRVQVEAFDALGLNADTLGKSNEVIVSRERVGNTNLPPKNTTNTAIFTFSSTNINGFSAHTIAFVWKYKDANNEWVRIKTLLGNVYFIPHAPNPPWIINKDDHNQNPWTDALDMVLGWGVRGMSDTVQIATQITKYINSSINFKYDIIKPDKNGDIYNRKGEFVGEGGGRTLLCEYDDLACTDFIKKVKDKQEIIGNCTDCATLVSTFSNLLGSDLYQIRFVAHFYCNKIKSIGFDNIWQYPFPQDKDGTYLSVNNTKAAVKGAFSYHEIAFDGEGLHTDKIYDACLKVNKNVLKGGFEEVLPTDMQFALIKDHEYEANRFLKDYLQPGDEIQYREMLLLDDAKNNLRYNEIQRIFKLRRYLR